MRLTFLALLLCLGPRLMGQNTAEQKIQRALIQAQDGSTIELEEGFFEISKSLSLEGKKNLTIQGKGIDKTILSFKNQVSGAEGLRISGCQNIRLENFSVEDSKGDLIKASEVQGMYFYKIRTAWTGTPKASNGGYGIYPVLCKGVVIDSCIAIGASDAGIYVGQSQDIEVRYSLARNNVAGIEIENSLDARVHHNVAIENTGGILVFDLPDLVQKKGGRVQVYDNRIERNNYPNFAPKGNIVASVPAGTGVLIMATSQVQVYRNQIIEHQTIGTGIISYLMLQRTVSSTDYDPYPSSIDVFENTFLRSPGRVPFKGTFGKLFRLVIKAGKNPPNIVYDGILDPKRLDAKGKLLPEYLICIRNNKGQSFLNLDAEHNFKSKSNDVSAYDCTANLEKKLD